MAITAATNTLLKVGDGASPEVFTTVAYVSNISGPNMTAGTYDVSNHNDVNGYRTFISGLKDGGEISTELFFDPNDTTHADIIDLFEDNSVVNWKIELSKTSPAKSWTFKGVVVGFEQEYPVDGPKTAKLTIKISGKPTLA